MSTSTSHFDLEAQRPAPAHTRSVLTYPIAPTDSAFGYTFDATPSSESRHDRRQSMDAPPAYAEDAAIPLPPYTRTAPEPATLAMFLFKFGFLFPPFWFFGAFILLSPLREPETAQTAEGDAPADVWMPEKTPDERAAILATLRSVEIKWAKRCLFAIVTLAILATIGGVAAWAVLRQ